MYRDLTKIEKDLADQMSLISERCYAAGWMINLEFILWDSLETGERTYGQGIISMTDINTLKELSNKANCWIFFDDDKEEIAIPLDQWEHFHSSKIQENKNILDG